MNARIYVEKRAGFQVEAHDLLVDIQDNLALPVSELRLINIYDVFDIKESILEQVKQTVFSEVMVDEILDHLDLSHETAFAMEYLPGQYDQRADSAMQCVQLLDPSSRCVIRSGKCIIIKGTCSDEQFKQLKKYCINPIESRDKNLDKLQLDENVECTPSVSLKGFIHYSKVEIEKFVNELGLAMSLDDCLYVQDYFIKTEQRDPSVTEIRVLDTYWSDHCRHTTFETKLKEITLNHDLFQDELQACLDKYITMKKSVRRENKPMTLMEMATINARYLRSKNILVDEEISDEINACSVKIDVDHNGAIEKWLLMFKNETHNHPTEIEPFGGASTCIGGAIRDPLSGRSYVYQAMRISGVGNIFEHVDETIASKLPQRVISKKATSGNSSYGNQIGLATTFVKEIIHPSYVAKHMEVGAVVGAVLAEDVRRESVGKDDVIILLGGKTGRDGIGGATGSSKEHNEKSLEICASEVQKGNAPEERKIQRLFRNSKVSKMIKKCNDFGAGGVCVAIGELADGLIIKLDLIQTKYAGLNATEIAISESQERMAVVVSKQDADAFIKEAENENLQAYVVATITEERRLKMLMNDEIVVDISRDFIDTNGVQQSVDVQIEHESKLSGFNQTLPCTYENILKTLSSANVACQKGLVERFDASIGSTTVLMPFGGITQLTPSQASVQRLPVLDGLTKTCSILTAGFDPQIFAYSPYIGAMMSVLDSIAKTIVVGGNLESIHFSFQEYFQRLNDEPKKWGQVVQALLGAMQVQDYFSLAAIGGKDSMSGTFKDLSVVPTLISFACSTTNVDCILTHHLKKAGNNLYILKPTLDDRGYPDLKSYQEIFTYVQHNHDLIEAGYVVEQGGILAAIAKMSFGSKRGFTLSSDLDLFACIPGAIILETKQDINESFAVKVGHVEESEISVNNIKIEADKLVETWTQPMNALYPMFAKANHKSLRTRDTTTHQVFKATHPVREVKVLVPVFPGTNCEYDTKRAFDDAGAVSEIFIFRNYDEKAIHQSIDELASKIDASHILAFPGGFSSGDEPDGSAKFIVNVLQNEKIKKAVHALLDREGLIIGICNGFQALIKSGLLPYGRISTLNESSPTLFRNNINRHVSTMVNTRVVSNNSPWLSSFKPGEVHTLPVSHGEGRFVVDKKTVDALFEKGQIAFQYCDEQGNPTMDEHFNINGSDEAIEGLVSTCGRILGKMAHSERYFADGFKNIEGNKNQNIFVNGVNYFKENK